MRSTGLYLPANGVEPDPARSHRAVAVLLILALGAALYLPAIDWGLPATVSWSQDTIAGVRTLGAVEEWPTRWHGRYPPLHYLILRAAYEPFLQHWTASGDLTLDPHTGRTGFTEPQAPKTGTLFLIAGLVSAAMGVGTGLVIYGTTRRLTGDDASAIAAAAAMMIGADFTYFAHLGNVDVPSTFWFACTLPFYLRLCHAVTLRDAVLVGLFGSLAISTKDAVACAFPGMAVALLVLEFHRQPTWRSPLRKLLDSLRRGPWLAGIAAFILPYLILNGALTNPQGYLARMKYWFALNPDTLHAQEYRFSSPFELAVQTLRQAASGLGWPMLAAMLIATTVLVVAGLLRKSAPAPSAPFPSTPQPSSFPPYQGGTEGGHAKHTARSHLEAHSRAAALLLLAPALSHLLLLLATTRFVYARFLFPVFVIGAILVGIAIGDLWKRKLLASWTRNVLVFFVFMPSLAYAMAVNAEMLTDSRYDAETWFLGHAPPPADVGAFCKPQYLPRLHELGYRTFLVEMKRESFERPQPPYLVLTSFDYEDYDEPRKECMNELLKGTFGYREVVRFQPRFFGAGRSTLASAPSTVTPGQSVLAIAGWGAPPVGKISPTLIILRRADE